MNTGKKIVAIILVAVMAFGFGLAGGLCAEDIKDWYAQRTADKDGKSELIDISNADLDNKKSGSTGNIVINVSEDYSLAEAIAEKVMPSVVSVTTTYEQSYSYYFPWGNGQGGTQEASCVGTGFIVDSHGYIVSNSHVVKDGDYTNIKISLYDGSEQSGEVLWSDSTLDLAVIKINNTQLDCAELGDSDLVKIGGYAAAIGNPLGLTFERSMSQGIISGLDRTITVSSGSSGSGTTMEGLFQTDAAINSGNSGGPLLNAKGQVIGVASAKASTGENMGFAIPINIIKPIIKQIIETGSFQRVYLGITAIGIEQQSSISKEALESYYGSSKGIYVASVTKGGGAEAAGLKEGDVILKVNGTEVGTMNKMYSILVSFKSGDTVDVSYLRNGTIKEATVKLMTSAELDAILQ